MHNLDFKEWIAVLEVLLANMLGPVYNYRHDSSMLLYCRQGLLAPSEHGHPRTGQRRLFGRQFKVIGLLSWFLK